ncbi:MAG TPA: Fic family protein [Candidatus Sulfotelmatobacter sp.]|nr:Fic family protein [Candidatus Sulfotelmatobacter sp.]
MHVPLNREAVRDGMPAFFDLLREESHPAVRVVLGHFVFVYIHPYMDGNGGVGRFLMNAMMASAGYPWTVIPVGERNAYLKYPRKSERRPGHRSLRGLPRRAGSEAAGWRAVATGSEV